MSAAQAPVGGNGSGGERHHQYIEAIEHVDQKAERNHAPLEADHGFFVQLLPNRLAHGVRLRSCGWKNALNDGQPKPPRYAEVAVCTCRYLLVFVGQWSMQGAWEPAARLRGGTVLRLEKRWATLI
ncbi:hypothetical protein D9M71_465560 [compost metagenome]